MGLLDLSRHIRNWYVNSASWRFEDLTPSVTAVIFLLAIQAAGACA
jgi:hypothetical protein